MEMAIMLSVAAAINTLSYDHSHPYSEILDKSLDLTKDFFAKFTHSPHTNLIRLYEFYILVMFMILFKFNLRFHSYY